MKVRTSDIDASGTRSASTFLRGDDTWAVPAGGGGGGLSLISEAVITSPLATISFPSIPATFRDLRVTGLIRSHAAVGFVFCGLQMNGDTGANYNYSRTNRFGTGQAFSATSIQCAGTVSGSSNGPSAPCSFAIDIPHYLNTTMWKSLNGTDFGSDLFTPLGHYLGGVWRNTSAINRLDFFLETGPFSVGSAIRLWGIT